MAERLQARFGERRRDGLSGDLVRVNRQLHLPRGIRIELDEGLGRLVLEHPAQLRAQAPHRWVGKGVQPSERVVDLGDVGIRERHLQLAEAERVPPGLRIEGA